MARDYDGRVRPGGPAQLRDLGVAALRKVSVGPMDNNCYLLTCAATSRQLLIDAANDAPRLGRLLIEGEPTGSLDAIVTTHAHFDHVGALAELAASTGAQCYAGRGDVPDLPELPAAPIPLDDGDRVRVGDIELDVITLEGHTPGSIALALRDAGGRAHLFTGDSLFPGGVGNTWGDADRFASLLRDVSTKLFDRFDDDAWVYPGHGPDTTIGAERWQLAAWRERGW